jgi:histidine triad (HIT) family protein
MLTDEQVESMKSQLIKQIEASFPEDKREFAISQIEAMDSEQLENFLIKNNLIKKDGTTSMSGNQCVFCSIVFGDINSYKIAENSKAIAVLEINPVSRGHVIIIPKEHIASEKGMPEEIKNLAKKVSLLIKTRLKPENVKIVLSNVMGHEIFNIIPVYEGQKDASERKSANPEELDELQKILIKKSDVKRTHKRKINIKKVMEKFSEEYLWLPKRIP